MPWVQLLLLVAVVYVVVLVVWGLVQVVPWFIEQFIEPRRLARSKENPPRRSGDAGLTGPSAAGHRARTGGGRIGLGEKTTIAMLRMTGRLAGPLGALGRLLVRKDLSYWVGLSLEASDPSAKVKYCSKALRLDPGYEPAWGLKALSLLQLQRYEEAIGCFDKVLELRPHATAWYKKGLCCFHLKRHQDALACFDKALAACHDGNPRLLDEVAGHKRLAEEALR
jgi:hypothetical protein